MKKWLIGLSVAGLILLLGYCATRKPSPAAKGIRAFIERMTEN